MNNITARTSILTALTAFTLITVAFSQRPTGDRVERFRTMSTQAEEKGLAEEFKGITTDGTVAQACSQYGPPASPPSRSARRPTRSSPRSHPSSAPRLFAVDDPEWRKWMNQHFYMRQGVSFKEMTEASVKRAFGLLRASLSAQGAQAHARHHAAEPHARRVEQQQLRANTASGSTTSPSWARRRRPSHGAGSSTAITRSSTTSCSAIRS